MLQPGTVKNRQIGYHSLEPVICGAIFDRFIENSVAAGADTALRETGIVALNSGISFGRLLQSAAVILAFGALATPFIPAPADAQEYDSSARQRRSERRAEARRSRDARSTRREARDTPSKREATPKVVIPKVAVLPGPPEPLVAVISIPSQRIQVHNSTGMLAESRVSTGQSGHRTPTGVFSVLQRNRYHESNIYSGAPMPFMQRVTWSGIAMHQGVVPGYPASHGCIRLPGEFASKMWGLGRVGMRVIITPSDVQPQAIAHAKLPAPAMTAVAANAAPDSIQTASVVGAGAATEQRLLDPFKYAQSRKLRAASDIVVADKAVPVAFEAARSASADASRASEDLRRLEQAAAASEQKVAARKDDLARVAAANPDSDAAKALAAAEQERDTSSKDLAAARVAERTKSDAAFDAAKAARESEAALAKASDAAKLANVATEYVSIFVSRKEGRVFVRQGFVPIHDEPIAFTEGDRPLGTHVYTAMSAKDGGAAVDWAVVTVPSNPPEVKEKAREKDAERSRGKKGGRPAEVEAKPQLPASTASAALDRFDLPEATKKIVAERIWPGATLTVSDFGISGETGKGTDFVVLTK